MSENSIILARNRSISSNAIIKQTHNRRSNLSNLMIK